MTDDKWRDDSGTDHPQTIDSEPLERTRSARLLEEDAEHSGDAAEGQPTSDESGSERAVLSDADAEAVARHSRGAHSIGDAIGASAGFDQGSGTSGDKSGAGGGDPQNVG